MKRLLKKLRERRGASLVFALLIFLMCALAGTVALTAASANVGRYTHLEAEQRDYLSVASALELIQKKMNEAGPSVTVQYVKTEKWYYDAAGVLRQDEDYALTLADPLGVSACSDYEKLLLLNSVPEEWYTATYGDGVSLQKEDVEFAVPASFPTNEAYRLHLDPGTGTPEPAWKDSLQDVVVVIDKDASYKLTMHFQVKRVDGTEDSYSYPITVTWPGTVSTDTKTEVKTTGSINATFGSVDGSAGTRTTTTTLTCSLVWAAEDRAITAG